MQHFKISSKHLIINRLLKKINHQQQDNSNEHQTRIGWFLEFIEHICSSSSSNVDDRKETYGCSTFEKKIRSYLHSFGTQSLKQLLNVIENNQQVGPCILAPSSQSPVPSLKKYDQESLVLEDEESSFDLKLLQWFMCKIRNINFQSQIHNPLRPLPWCSLYHQIHPHPQGRSSLCLNPYHWACLMPREDNNILQYYDENQFGEHHFPSTPCSDDVTKTAVDNEYFLPNNVLCSETVSVKSSDNNGVWCKLSYWEKRQTILSDINVKSRSIHIQAHDHSQDGHNYTNDNITETTPKVFLPSLSLQNSTNPSSSVSPKHRKEVEKTREKIGLGVTIFRDTNQNVWLYNRSTTYSIFVESPALSSYCNDFNKISNNNLKKNHSQTTMNNVVKVLPGHLFKAYDWEISKKMKTRFNTDSIMPDGTKSATTKIDFDQFRFSFLKGFGQNYERSEIMLCPCWMEVMLYL